MEMEKCGRKLADDTEFGRRNEEDNMRKKKLWMAKCARKIADDKILITPNADGKKGTPKCGWQNEDNKTSRDALNPELLTDSIPHYFWHNFRHFINASRASDIVRR